MLEVGNALLAKDPKNLGMLLLVSDYYGEKGEQLDKAESYARQAATWRSPLRARKMSAKISGNNRPRCKKVWRSAPSAR